MSDQHRTRGSRKPISDLTVLDLTQILAGPFASMLLADLGAEVIKVEPPQGEAARSNPPFLTSSDAYGGYFQSVNRNKKSIALDLKSPSGKETFKRLVEDADVVLENFKVGTMDRLGLSYETLQEVNPGLVYASIRGFGDPRLGESPYAERPAFDFIAQAMGGIMSITGSDADDPTKVGPGVGDIFPGVLSIVGVLAALRHRDRTGEGQYVDVGMVDGVLALCERLVYQYSFEGEVPTPQGNSHPIFFPYDRFEAEDGYVVIAAPEDHQWAALCEHMERGDLAESYPDKQSRIDSASELRPIVQEWTQRFERDELIGILEEDVPCAPVFDAADVFADEHFDRRDMLTDVRHADTDTRVTITNTPIKFSETPAGVERSAPFLGEHTRTVLRDAGFDEEDVDTLVDDGVAFEPDEPADQ